MPPPTTRCGAAPRRRARRSRQVDSDEKLNEPRREDPGERGRSWR